MGLDTVDDGAKAVDQDLRARLRAEMAARGLSQAKAAAGMEGVSQTTLSQYLSGTYPAADVSGVEARISKWLDSLAARDTVTAARVAEPGWLQTPTAQSVWAMLTQAQHAPDMVVVAGAPGLGKTMTAEAYAAARPHVWIATMDPMISGPTAMLTELAQAMEIRVGAAILLRGQIGEKVKGTGGLIVIDEAQHLRKPSLDMLRSLHDRYRIGVALLGNHGLYGGTVANSAADGFAQFFSRVGMRRRFADAQASDVDMLLDGWGIVEPAARSFLKQVAGKPGALRGVVKTIRAGVAMAAGTGEALGAAHLKAAWAANA